MTHFGLNCDIVLLGKKKQETHCFHISTPRAQTRWTDDPVILISFSLVAKLSLTLKPPIQTETIC